MIQRVVSGLAVVGLIALGGYLAAHAADPSTQAFGSASGSDLSAPVGLPPAPADTGISSSDLPFVNPQVHPADHKVIKSLLYAAAVKRGINPYLVLGLAWHESGWQPSVVSHAGAVGVMQVMPSTAALAGPRLLHRSVNLFDAADNIDMGTALFRAELDRFGNDYVKATVAYYAGGGAVREWSALTDGERRYVRSVFADAQLFATGHDPA